MYKNPGSLLWCLLLCFQALPFSSAQSYTTIPQSACLNPIAATAKGFGKCDSMISEFTKCNNDKAAAKACICRQEILNGLFEYENNPANPFPKSFASLFLLSYRNL